MVLLFFYTKTNKNTSEYSVLFIAYTELRANKKKPQISLKPKLIAWSAFKQLEFQLLVQ